MNIPGLSVARPRELEPPSKKKPRRQTLPLPVVICDGGHVSGLLIFTRVWKPSGGDDVTQVSEILSSPCSAGYASWDVERVIAVMPPIDLDTVTFRYKGPVCELTAEGSGELGCFD